MPLKINGATSGSVTLAAPATGSDVTLTLPGSDVNLASIPQSNVTNLTTDLAAKTNKSGSILQVVTQNRTDTFSASVASASESGDVISVSITPSSTSSRILVLVTCNVAGTEAGMFVRLYRGSTKIFAGDTASSRQTVASSTRNSEPATPEQVGIVFVDSPSTTSSTTYAIRLSHQASTTQTVYLNRGVGDGDTAPTPRTASSITVLEIGA